MNYSLLNISIFKMLVFKNLLLLFKSLFILIFVKGIRGFGLFLNFLFGLVVRFGLIVLFI